MGVEWYDVCCQKSRHSIMVGKKSLMILSHQQDSVPLVSGKSCFGECFSWNSTCSREDEGILTCLSSRICPPVGLSLSHWALAPQGHSMGFPFSPARGNPLTNLPRNFKVHWDGRSYSFFFFTQLWVLSSAAEKKCNNGRSHEEINVACVDYV